MPWKRFGKCVYKTSKTGKKKEKQGCSDSVPMAKKYLKALYANENDVSEQVNDYLNEILLFEARMKDIKKKYPSITALGWTGWAKEQLEDTIGPKSSSKYLGFWVRELERRFRIEEKIKSGEEYLDTYQSVADITAGDEGSLYRFGSDLISLLKKFEKLQPTLMEKDINKYDYQGLEDTVGSKDSSSEEKRKEKQKAKEESELIYDRDDIIAYRPLSEPASCFWGKGTRWCISATEYRNEYNNYTKDGYAFTQVIFRNTENVQPNLRKLALVFDEEAELVEMYDAPDARYMGGDIEFMFKLAIAQNLYGINDTEDYKNLDPEKKIKIENIHDVIIEDSSTAILNNPPDASAAIEERIEQLEKEYKDQIKHGYYSAEYDEYVHFNGGFSIELDASRFLKEPDNYREESEITKEIQRNLDLEASVYVEEVEYLTYNDIVEVRIFMNTYDYQPDTDGYEHFLQDMYDYDQKYKSMYRVVQLTLQKMGYLSKGAFDSLDSDDLQNSLNNFGVIDNRKYVGDEELILRSDPVTLKDIELSSQNLYNLDFEAQARQQFGGFINQDLNNIIVSKLNALNQKIVKALRSQMPLPGIPQQKIKELTIPEMLEVRLHTENTRIPFPVELVIMLKIEDVDIEEQNMKAIIGVVKFIDENFEEIAEIAENTASSFIKKKIEIQNRELEKARQASAKLGRIDAEDGTNPVNEVDEYFKDLLKTELDRRIEKMTIEEWLDPDIPAPWDKDYEDKK